MLSDGTGIYAIENLACHRAYVGGTKRGFWQRWYTHVSSLRVGSHSNAGLQKDWTIYGARWFKFVPLEVVLSDDQTAPREQYWIDFLKSQGYHCYNLVRAYEYPLNDPTTIIPLTSNYDLTVPSAYTYFQNRWRIDLSESRLSRDIRSGQLPAIFRSGRWYVRSLDLPRYLTMRYRVFTPIRRVNGELTCVDPEERHYEARRQDLEDYLAQQRYQPSPPVC